MENLTKKIWLFFFLFCLGHPSFPQNDSLKSIDYLSGDFSVTNNGISLIPSFTLEKPAVLFDFSIGGKKLSFDPQLRFALEGKPWTFLFWWRYKLLSTHKWKINLGAHPALNFRTESVLRNGDTTEINIARRYLAGEISPGYLISDNVRIGMYYLYSYGLEKNIVKNTHFLTLNSTFSNIKLSNQIFLKVAPQLYYLKLDREDGIYFTSALTLTKRNFPMSLSSTINKTIRTDISISKNFVWNASVIYSFNKQFVKVK